MQSLGENAKYIKIDGTGPNALDFHISYYMGVIAQKDSNAYFHIVTKDTGFDPLIKHLRDKKIFAQRVADISEIQSLQSPKHTTPDERIDLVLERLTKMGNAKPRRVQGLENTIDSLFRKELTQPELLKLISILKSKQFLRTEGEKIIYSKN